MLENLFSIVENRKNKPVPGSYTSSLITAGEDEILKKIGEESMEIILAAKNQGDERVIEEIADLFYHCLVLLSARNIKLSEIEAELEQRNFQKQIGNQTS